VLTPLAQAEWEHEFKGDRRAVTATALVDGTRVSTFTSNPDRDYFNLGVGLSATFKSGFSAFLYFEETLGRARFTNHSFTGGVRVEF
jgi:outer membrane autotransporter protein